MSRKKHYLLANKNFMRQFNHLYSYHVIYIERWEHGTEGVGLNLNLRWRLKLMSYSWIIV